MRYLGKIGGVEHKIEFQNRGRDLSVRVNNERFLVIPLSLTRSALLSLLIDNRPYSLSIDKEEDDYLITINGESIRVGVAIKKFLSIDRPKKRERLEGILKSRMAGRVSSIDVMVGDRVERGKRLLVVEAMKMENEIRASKAGTVKEIFVSEGDIIMPGESLMGIG